VSFGVGVLGLLMLGCMDTAHLSKERLQLSIDPEVRFADRQVILLIVDGLRADVFERELEAGRLPNIDRFLVRRGLWARRCVSSLITCTYPDIAAMLTGSFPGHNGVPSMTHFDRDRLVSRRYDSPNRMGRVRGDLERPTAFQMLAPDPTVCILTQVSAGATYFIENLRTAGLAFFFRQWRRLDYLSLVRFRLVAQLARQWGEYPRLVVTYLPSMDYVAYHYGVESPRYLSLLHHADFLVGLLVRALEEEGVLDRFAFVLTADHGHIQTRPDGHFDIRGFVDREVGIPATSASASEGHSWRERRRRFGSSAAVVLNAGNRSAMLYLRSFEARPSDTPRPWSARPTLEELRRYPSRSGQAVDLVQELLSQEALELVLARAGPDAVAVFSRRGRGLIRRCPPEEPGGDPRYQYSVLAGEDPVGYTDVAGLASLVGGGYRPGREWLARSLGSRYPDFVPQVVELFDGARVGDLVVFARQGWSFHPGHASDHGGPLAGEMLVPLVVAGPGIPQGELGGVRQVDILPTVLEYLGRDVPGDEIDGRSFLPETSAPGPVIELRQ